VVRAASPGRSAQGLQQRRACSISGAGTCLTSRADSLWQLPAAGPRWSLARRVGARPPSSSGCIMFFAALIGVGGRLHDKACEKGIYGRGVT